MRVALRVTTAVVILLLAARASARPHQDPEFEAKIAAEIQARDPRNAGIFFESQIARKRGDAEEEARLLEQVHERDPWFSHATRRLCGYAASKNDRERALSLCREAFATEALPLNEAALAMVLATLSSSESDRHEASRLSRAAASRAPNDTYVQSAACQCAVLSNDLPTLDSCSRALERLDPDDEATAVFATIREAAYGHLDAASAELERAHARGLPDSEYRHLREGIDSERSPVERWGPLVGLVIAGWLAFFAVLLGLGALLSAMTLRSIARASSTAGGSARGTDATLRRLYRVVLLVTCVYYYLSLPIVAVLLLVLGGGLIWATFAVGHVPIKLVLIVVVIVGASLWAMAKSLFVRARDEDPGEKIDLGKHPQLRALLDEVAARIGTRPVDSVYMTPGTEIAVLERGGMMKQLSGKSERCLVLGAAVLDGMRVREFKAILAHEYGHFHNEDTAGGGFALAVRRSLMTMALHLVRGRAASALNPAWWFVRGFHAVFLRVSQGASRLQEVLADRWAAHAYGSEAFSRGLKHVVERSVRFDAHVHATLNEVVPKKQPLPNMYAHVPTDPVDPKKVDEAIAEAMTRPASPYDSHPRPADRIEWVNRLSATTESEKPGDAEDAWSLLEGREGIEKEMTAKVRANLAEQGVALRG
jgi:Zn-dependent protease with chaperone function